MTKKIFLLLLLSVVFISGCYQEGAVPPIHQTFYDVDLGNITVKNLKTDSFELMIPVEVDLRFPVTLIKQGQTNPPEQTDFTLDFSHSRVENAYVVAQMSHIRAENTNITAHFHWQTANNNAGDVVWGIKYSCASIDSSFPDFQTKTVVSSSVENSTIHIMSDEILIEAEDLGVSGICKIELFRDTNDIRDTYVGDAKLIGFDIHYLVNKLGETLS